MAARPTAEPQPGLPPRGRGAAPESQPSGPRRPEAARTPPGGSGLRPTSARSESSPGRKSPCCPAGRCGSGGWEAAHPRIPSCVGSRFYSVYRQPSRQTEQPCVRHWKGPQRRTSPNRLFYRPEHFHPERSTCPGTLGNSGPEPALNFLLASVLPSFKDLAGRLLTPSSQCQEEPQTTPRQGSFFLLPFQIQPLDSRDSPGSQASGGFLVGEGRKRRASWSVPQHPHCFPCPVLPWS